MGCGGWVGDLVRDPINTIENTKTFSSPEDFWADTTNTVGGAFKLIGAPLSIIAHTFAVVGKAAGWDDMYRLGTSVNNVNDAFFSSLDTYAEYTLNDPKSLYTNQNGDFDILKVASLALAVISGPAGWAAYIAMQSGAINNAVAQMAKEGWIADKHAALVAATITLAMFIYAAQFSNAPAWIQPYLPYINIGMAAASIYQTSEQMREQESEYRKAKSEFDSWFSSLKEKQEQADIEVQSYVSGRYYKYFAGQTLFNVGQSSRERYVPMTVQEPCYGIFHQRMTTEDEFVNKLLWKDKNYNMPAGGSFMQQQMSGAMVQLGN